MNKLKTAIQILLCPLIILCLMPINITATSANKITPMIETETACSAGLTDEGKIIIAGVGREEKQKAVDDLTGVVQIDNTFTYLAALKSDGTVFINMWNSQYDFGQTDAENWSDIVQISATYDYIVGVKSDGTVISTEPPSDYDYGQTEVSDWKDIIQVSAGDYINAGLKSDGTVVIAGKDAYGYDKYEADISTWTDIVEIKTSEGIIVGLKSNGTLVAASGSPPAEPECQPEENYISPSWRLKDLSTWTDIVSFDVSGIHVIGVKKDGSIVISGYAYCCIINDCYEIEKWTDIVSVSITSSMLYESMHCLGLKSNGELAWWGENYYGQCDVSDWDLVSKDTVNITLDTTIKTVTPTNAKIFVERTSGEVNGAVSYVLLKGDYSDTNFSDSTFEEIKNHPDFVDYKISNFTKSCTFNLNYLEKNQNYTIVPFMVKGNVHYFGVGENTVFSTLDITVKTEIKKLTENSAQFRLSRTGTANGALGYVLLKGDYSDINYKTLEEYTAMGDFVNNHTSSWTGRVVFIKENLESGEIYTIIPYTQKGSNCYFGLGDVITFTTK